MLLLLLGLPLRCFGLLKLLTISESDCIVVLEPHTHSRKILVLDDALLYSLEFLQLIEGGAALFDQALFDPLELLKLIDVVAVRDRLAAWVLR